MWVDFRGCALAAPVTPLYAAAVGVRAAAYDSGLCRGARAPLPVISVGGLETGGSGKTQVVGWLVAALQARGWRPLVLGRGHGRGRRGLALRLAGQPAAPAALGDELAMLVAQGLDVPMAACGRRRLGAEALAPHGDVLLLDDGFAHRQLRRDVDIVVLRGGRPLGRGPLLPGGTLREPVACLRRAQVIWWHYRDAAAHAVHPAVAAACPGALHVVSRAAVGRCTSTAGLRVELAGAAVLGAAGIARPASFRRQLEAAGALVQGFVAFADHHGFTAADVRRLRRAQAAAGARAVAVTPKDFVKLRPLWPDNALWQVGTELRPEAGATALLAALAALGPAGAAQKSPQ